MSSRDSERTVRQSVLDRLTDTNPGFGDAPTTFSESVRQTKVALLRDLEWLMNTRRIAVPADDTHPEVQRSVYHYGLPDTTALSGEDPNVRRRLQREIQECLRLFEPRLTQIEVTAVPPTEETKRQVRFMVEALLQLDPDPERVVFDTVLDVSSGAFSMQTGHG
jgi:type VI secretion system protein ImpF